MYIDDVLIHMDTHEKHLEAPSEDQLGQMPFWRPTGVVLRIHPDSRWHQTRRSQTKGDQTCNSARSFVGLCNFFRNHIQGFAITAAPLFKLTRQDSGWHTWTQSSPDPTLPATSTRIPEVRSRLPSDQECLQANGRSTRRTLCHLGTKGQ